MKYTVVMTIDSQVYVEVDADDENTAELLGRKAIFSMSSDEWNEQVLRNQQNGEVWVIPQD